MEPALSGARDIERALRLVGELLEAKGHHYHIAIIGGAAVNLLGFVSRVTTDVDILAFATAGPAGVLRLGPPEEPLPEPLLEAAITVAGDLGLDPHWLNTGPASQWQTGLPPGLEKRVRWSEHGGLTIGLVDRYDLIFFKLYAAADHTGTQSVHFQDLLALQPTNEELGAAADWVHTQDPSPDFANVISIVIKHVRELSDRPR